MTTPITSYSQCQKFLEFLEQYDTNKNEKISDLVEKNLSISEKNLKLNDTINNLQQQIVSLKKQILYKNNITYHNEDLKTAKTIISSLTIKNKLLNDDILILKKKNKQLEKQVSEQKKKIKIKKKTKNTNSTSKHC